MWENAPNTLIIQQEYNILGKLEKEMDMDFSERQEKKIIHMITKGEKMEAIARKVGRSCTWEDIQQFCWETGFMSWQGSKRMISTRLRKFATATKESERKKLAGEIDESVSYLYYCAKQMRSRIVEVEKALKKITL